MLSNSVIKSIASHQEAVIDQSQQLPTYPPIKIQIPSVYSSPHNESRKLFISVQTPEPWQQSPAFSEDYTHFVSLSPWPSPYQPPPQFLRSTSCPLSIKEVASNDSLSTRSDHSHKETANRAEASEKALPVNNTTPGKSATRPQKFINNIIHSKAISKKPAEISSRWFITLMCNPNIIAMGAFFFMIGIVALCMATIGVGYLSAAIANGLIISGAVSTSFGFMPLAVSAHHHFFKPSPKSIEKTTQEKNVDELKKNTSVHNKN